MAAPHGLSRRPSALCALTVVASKRADRKKLTAARIEGVVAEGVDPLAESSAGAGLRRLAPR